MLFLAGIGLRAGPTFANALTEPSALLAVATGAAVTTTGLVLVVAGGIGLLKLPTQTLVGALGGMSHPAVLAYASDQLRDDRELTLSYASVFALALITKIVLAQTLITWML